MLSTGRGLGVAALPLPDPIRSRRATRLGWAVALSVAAHFVLFVTAHPTLRAASHPVSVLLVRTIAAARALPAAEAEAKGPPAAAPAVPSPGAPAAHREAATAAAPASDRGGRAGVSSASPAGAHGPAAPARRDAAPPQGMPAPADPAAAYHLAGELDPAPVPLQDIEPEYPPEAGFQPGKVVLRLLIDESGHVDRVDVLRASPAGLFEDAARSAFGAARFSPGRIAGIAVKCQMTIEVEFTPINRGNEVSGRTY
jgi:TonB family protein